MKKEIGKETLKIIKKDVKNVKNADKVVNPVKSKTLQKDLITD